MKFLADFNYDKANTSSFIRRVHLAGHHYHTGSSALLSSSFASLLVMGGESGNGR